MKKPQEHSHYHTLLFAAQTNMQFTDLQNNLEMEVRNVHVANQWTKLKK